MDDENFNESIGLKKHNSMAIATLILSFLYVGFYILIQWLVTDAKLSDIRERIEKKLREVKDTDVFIIDGEKLTLAELQNRIRLYDNDTIYNSYLSKYNERVQKQDIVLQKLIITRTLVGDTKRDKEILLMLEYISSNNPSAKNYEKYISEIKQSEYKSLLKYINTTGTNKTIRTRSRFPVVSTRRHTNPYNTLPLPELNEMIYGEIRHRAVSKIIDTFTDVMTKKEFKEKFGVDRPNQNIFNFSQPVPLFGSISSIIAAILFAVSAVYLIR